MGASLKQYDPYFSADWDWEWEEALASVGVTAIVTYDALGRALRTDFPDGTTSRVVFTSWHVEQWDPNDTVADTGNLWAAARAPGAIPTPAPEDVTARSRALAHAETPGVVHLDSLGRAFLAEQFLDEDAYEDPTALANEPNVIETRSVLDIEGQVREVKDAYARACMRYTYAVDGQVLKQESIDSGDKWSLTNVLGAPFRAWDAVGHRTRVELDELQRPTHVWVKKGAGAKWLAARVYYGESVASPEDDNAREGCAHVRRGGGRRDRELRLQG